MKLAVRAQLAVIACALALGACGGGGSNSPPPLASNSSTGASGTAGTSPDPANPASPGGLDVAAAMPPDFALQ
jgi:hypothetical protein